MHLPDALDIEISGSVASSLKQATGLSEKELKRLSEASRIMNGIIRKQITDTFRGMERESFEVSRKEDSVL